MSIKLKGSSDGSVSLDAPADTSPSGTDVTFVLPTADGTGNQVLSTDGSGNLSFADNVSSGRNLVGNGSMIVAQRGTANATPVGYQTVDRFFTSGSGGTFSQERIDLTSSDSPFSLGFRHAYRVKNSAVASANNHYRQFETRIEAQDVVKSGWNYNSTSSYITVSFWARASVAGTYTFDFRTQDSPAQAYPTSITLAADTWKKFELTYPGDSALVIADDNGVGLRLVWGVYFGSNFTDSNAVMDAWHAFSSLNIAPDDTAGWGTTLNATFDVTGVQCEVGSVATKFEHRSFGDELLRCQRYLYRVNRDPGSADEMAIGTGSINNSSTAQCYVLLPVTMRANSQAITEAHLSVISGPNVTDVSLNSSLDEGNNCVGVNLGADSGTPFTTGRAALLRVKNSSGAFFQVSSEL